MKNCGDRCACIPLALVWKALVRFGAAAVTISVAAPAFAEPRTHDAFQFRGTVGIGYWLDFEDPDAEGVIGGTFKGAAVPVQLFFGGTVRRGLIVGGYAGSVIAPAPAFTEDGGGQADGRNLRQLGSFGAYLDYYPDPAKGFHAIASLGPGILLASGLFRSSGVGIGIAASAGVGYDWWIEDEWSLGALAKLEYAHTNMSGERSDVTENVVIPTLAFSVQYQ